MKITIKELRQIIKEEIESVHQEGFLPSFGDIKDMFTMSPEERAAKRKAKAEREVIDDRKLIIMCHEYKRCEKLFAKEEYASLSTEQRRAAVAKKYAEMKESGELKDIKNDPFSYPHPNLQEQFDPKDDIFRVTTGLYGTKVKDPLDDILVFIDKVNDAAMEKMGITHLDLDDWQFSELANKVVKDAANEISPSGDISNDELLAILKDQMPQLVDDLISRHQNPKLEPVDADFSDPGDDELPTIGFRGNKKIITKGEQ